MERCGILRPRTTSDADWKKQSTEWTEAVYKLYKQYGAFFEYNSPTYCGVDIYGLALWRSYGSTPRIRSIGSEMEAGLWRDIATLYQPELRNISGPYDRAYGMDMESYVSVDGVWMRTVLDAKQRALAAHYAHHRSRARRLVCASHRGARHAHSRGRAQEDEHV